MGYSYWLMVRTGEPDAKDLILKVASITELILDDVNIEYVHDLKGVYGENLGV